jgi:dihydrolipoamide dehydrogenase
VNDVDLVILGGGSGGYAAALRASQLGLSVVLVERDRLGGTCLHQGCVPTKALLHAAELADAARAGASHGILATFAGVDLDRVNAFKDGVVQRLYKGLQGLVQSSGTTLVRGEGRLAGPTSVEVAGELYTGTNLVLATGSHPRTLPGIELDDRVMTSEQALGLTEVPERAVIIGGSVIGVEFASVWRSFGSEVTIVEGLPSLVPIEDPAIGQQLERAFRKRGIGFRTGVPVRDVTSSDSGAVVTLEGGDVLAADVVLVAIGRGPATVGLGYEENGIELDRGWVTVDDRLRTSVSGVYAVGDLVPGLQLAHRGFAHGIFVAEEIAGLGPDPVEDVGIPRITYCDPEIASVGLTEPQAREVHGDVTTYDYNLAGNGKSQILGTTGFVKVVQQTDGPIVGVHMLGARMGEQVGEAALWVNWEALPEDVARFVHAHPTQNESLGEAALALAGKPLHAHG